MDRRRFLTGMAGILAAGYSASVLPSGVIMPIRKLWTPIEWEIIDTGGLIYYDGYVFTMTPRSIIVSSAPGREYIWDTLPRP